MTRIDSSLKHSMRNRARRGLRPLVLLTAILLAGCASSPSTSMGNNCVGPISYCTPFFGS
jgi:hypothetical protein